METSYEKVRKTKAFKILEFIEDAKHGRTFSEIQEFIVTLNGRDWNDMTRCAWNSLEESFRVPVNRRRYRGYYCTILLGGMHYHQGLLHTYCVKMPDGKWILSEDIWTRTNLFYGHDDTRSDTKTWRFNLQLHRGRQEEWRDRRGDSARPWDGKNRDAK
jgi:hypothetical protein